MRQQLVLLSVLMVVACAPNTKAVKLNQSDADTMPREVAIDVVTAFSKMSATDKDTYCVFTQEGVHHKKGGETVAYENTYFTVKNVAYSFVDYHPFLYIYNQKSGEVVCESFFTMGNMGNSQSDFNRKFKWFGTALISLGSIYSETGTFPGTSP